MCLPGVRTPVRKFGEEIKIFSENQIELGAIEEL
jgi:hypothetical protein